MTALHAARPGSCDDLGREWEERCSSQDESWRDVTQFALWRHVHVVDARNRPT